ncbi:MAG TPA: hypothetical protein VE891_13950 [Allosphingosinicella sp.]|nr:hypothetical protein [Allosphingosinicella sp.]
MARKLAALWALPALAACTEPAQEAAADRPPPSVAAVPAGGAEGGVRLALLEPADEGPASALPGRLELHGRCLYLRLSDGSRVLPAFRLEGLAWNRSSGAVEWRGRAFRTGDRVELGGAFERGPPGALPWRQAPAAECDFSLVFAAWNITSAD